MSLLSLPNELLIMVASALHVKGLSRLSRTNMRLNTIATPILHRHAVADYQDTTALHWAAEKGHLPLVRLVLNKGCKVDPRDKDSWTPLHMAIKQDNVVLTTLLLERGANVSLRGKDGYNAIACAARWASLKMCRFLLLHKGADPHWRGDTGETLLHLPMRREEVDDNLMDILALLLSMGVNSAIGDFEYGVTPLHAAACKRETSMIRMLLDAGADINTPDINGFTPIFTPFEPSGTLFQGLSKKGNKAVVKLLLEREADLNCRCHDGYTVLHQASTVNNGMVDGTKISPARYVRKLISHGAKIHARDVEGRTPLHIAAMEGDKYTIRALLASGAMLDGLSYDGMTPMECAARADKPKNVLELMKAGAKPRFTSAQRSSVLHYAAINNWPADLARVLVKLGASPLVEDTSGDTPLALAVKHERKELACALRDAAQGKHKWMCRVGIGKFTFFEVSLPNAPPPKENGCRSAEKHIQVSVIYQKSEITCPNNGT